VSAGISGCAGAAAVAAADVLGLLAFAAGWLWPLPPSVTAAGWVGGAASVVPVAAVASDSVSAAAADFARPLLAAPTDAAPPITA